MKSGLSKRQKESARLIKNALIELIRRRNYEDITIAKLCEEATVSRNTFYRIFSSKDEVFESVVEEKVRYIIEDNEKRLSFDPINPNVEDRYNSFLKYYKHWYNERDFLRYIHKRNLFNFFYVYHEKYFVNNASDYVVYYYGYNETYRKYYYKWHSYSIATIIEQWTENGFTETPEELADLTIQLYSAFGHTK